MFRKTPLVVIALVALLASAWPLPTPSAGASSGGFLSDVNNTVVVDTSLSPGDVLTGEELNGTSGYLFAWKLPSDGEFMLVSPSGASFGPANATNGTAFFGKVPLDDSGTWQIETIGGEKVSEFYTTQESSLISDLLAESTVLVDQSVDRIADLDYRLGSAEIDLTRVRARCSPDPGPSIPNRKSFRVWAEYDVDLLEDDDRREYLGLVMLTTERWDGEEYDMVATTMPLKGKSEGNVSVYTEWEPDRTYYNDLTAVRYMGTGIVQELIDYPDLGLSDSCPADKVTVSDSDDSCSCGGGGGGRMEPEMMFRMYAE